MSYEAVFSVAGNVRQMNATNTMLKSIHSVTTLVLIETAYAIPITVTFDVYLLHTVFEILTPLASK